MGRPSLGPSIFIVFGVAVIVIGIALVVHIAIDAAVVVLLVAVSSKDTKCSAAVSAGETFIGLGSFSISFFHRQQPANPLFLVGHCRIFGAGIASVLVLVSRLYLSLLRVLLLHHIL